MWAVGLMLAGTVLAGSETAGSRDAPSREAAAEAYRLSEEASRLVQKGAWQGVERTYLRAVETGAPLSAAMHVAGARSSMQIGDATEARQRLLSAYELERDPEVLAWLTTYSRQYTRVTLTADPGAKLEVERRHFDAERARVVDRAAALLAETGAFDGLLPMGRYRVGAFWFKVREDDADIEQDLRACAKSGTCEEPR